MWLMAMTALTLASDAGPLGDAVAAAEAPKSLRAAFTVELTSSSARRVFSFDPRLPEDARWHMQDWQGVDPTLDEVASTWGLDAAPDGWLFPDDLRESLGPTVTVEDLGEAWCVRFHHHPSANDGTFDVWAGERLRATAWLDPVSGRFLRIDHSLPAPVNAPGGGRLIRYEQSHLLDTDPDFGLSFIAAYTVDMEARAGPRRITRRYAARVTAIEVFFANAAAEADFIAGQNGAVAEAALR